MGAPLCVLYKPETIAAAALLLATKLDNDRSNENWVENLQDIDVVQVHGKLWNLIELQEPKVDDFLFILQN